MANVKKANAKKVVKNAVKKVAKKAVLSHYADKEMVLRKEFRDVFMRCYIIAHEAGGDEMLSTACGTAGFAFGIAAAGAMKLEAAQEKCKEWANEIFEEKKARMLKKLKGGK